ncbi:MAG TPA: ribonucleoside-diphosphate reductase subunit alpha [Candidatus Paceibacterota bacterium]|nr:ribonucleoside-diphosphate reductase subunit alpha [Candidatus Paceibacterota bacterium]
MTITKSKPANGASIRSTMQVTKRNGAREPVDVNKIVRAVELSCHELLEVDPLRVATKTISGLYDGATTEELDKLSIRTASELIGEEPSYSLLAARLLSNLIHKEVRNQGLHSFSQSLKLGYELGLISETTYQFVQLNERKLNDAIDSKGDQRFEYFGMRTIYDRYLLRHPESRQVIETPQYFMLRVACGLSTHPSEAIELYALLSQLKYLPSSPTLFNSGTRHSQMSSCYLIDSPEDTLESIYSRYSQIAQLSKFAGGIGISWSRVRSRGSLIRGTNGHSNGIVPWLKTLDSSVSAVNQGGRRKGAACIYLETWHADIEEFLELRDNTGDESRRTHNLNLAHWIPDLFLRRVEEDAMWSLFDPSKVPHFPDLWGEDFENAYREAEEQGLAVRSIKARELYTRMLRTLAETGNGWMTFKDASNRHSNQTEKRENVVHLSNLCTEIVEVTNNSETAVCNLGSVNLAKFVKDGEVDWESLAETVRTAVRFLDRVIDINFYPSQEAAASNPKWRPVGLGLMGLQDLFFELRIPFDSDKALELSTKISAEIYFNALRESCSLAKIHGPHPEYLSTRISKGTLHFDGWAASLGSGERWDQLREDISKHGVRNSLLIAIAPTATIASIAGAYECIEPQVSNLFKRETLSGEFLQINGFLVKELKERGLWTPEIRDEIKRSEGSIQGIDQIPIQVRDLFRTAWELPQKVLIDLASSRAPFIDQSQSLNLFLSDPSIGKLSSMYIYAWKSGLKTTYYLRSRPATRIRQTTIQQSTKALSTSAAEALACSLENPESCEVCQ